MDRAPRGPNNGEVEDTTETELQQSLLLLALSRDVTRTLDLQEVLDRSLAALRHLLTFDGGSIQLIEGESLRLVAADPAATKEAYEFRLPVGEGFGGRVAATGEPIYSPDATVDERAHPEGRRTASTAGVRSYFAAPLIEGGRTIGLVQFDSTTVDAFPPRAQALVLAFMPTIAAAVQNARLFDRELQALRDLREAEEIKEDFLALVSHELRTPLTTIAGFAETIEHLAYRLDPSEVADFARRILASSRGLIRDIEELLDLASIERGVAGVRSEPTDVAALIRGWIDVNAPGISFHADPGAPASPTDPDRLVTIVRNLVENAIKFSPPGSPVAVRVEAEASGVAISVVDAGPGISEDIRRRMFEPFVQGERAITRTAGGFGIGLTLVRHLCARIGAALRIEATPGGGTTVVVSLPGPVGLHDARAERAAG